MGRGRARVIKKPPGRPPSKDTATSKIPFLNFPTTPRDDETVECSACKKSCTFREFRIHNIEAHYNVAKTVDDETLLDHKYFVRKLQEMARLTKITTFFCPRTSCESTYKSALGLAYHMETCGKTAEEVAACLVECEICHKKFTLPNLNWHKKNMHPVIVPVDPLIDNLTASIGSGTKRKSAVKAREFMKEISDYTIKTDGDDGDQRKTCQLDRDAVDEDFALTAYHMKKEIEDDEEDENFEVTPSIDFILGSEEIKLEPSAAVKRLSGAKSKLDFSSQAVRYLEAHPDSALDPWDTSVRLTVNPLAETLSKVNPLQSILDETELRQYLPTMETSLPFDTRKPSKEKGKRTCTTTEFHRIHWFEGEVVDTDENDFVSFAGGPITSLAWHPSGKYLALSTLRDISDEPNLLEVKTRPSSVQIYVQISPEDGLLPSSVFSQLLVIGLESGCVNHLQWSNYWPLSSDDSTNICVGYICAACEDSTCCIFTIQKTDFELPQTFSSKKESEKNVRLYKKTPEIILCIDEDAKIYTGQSTRFDWDEQSRYIVVGYVSGHIAVFDLLSNSKLLRTDVISDDGNSIIYLNPFWIIKSHISPVTTVVFDPKTSRYFYTGSMDRTLRTWDTELKQEVECKKVGSVIDMCWIRGWVHLGVCVDAAVSNPGSQYNFLRYYPVGSSQGRPNTVEYFNISSTSFFEGMTLCGSENGRVNISYYDSFWRECDYDRNKKKRNVINIGKIELDGTGFVPTKYAKKEEEIIPFPENDEPQISLIFSRERYQGSQEAEPKNQEVENCYRYYKFIRVNKVCWSPGGKFITIGYRNGLFVIIPVDFDKLFC